MVNSMTGYGKYSDIISDREITVEIKSVNHRFFECNVRTPRFYNYLDIPLKKIIGKKVNRGKVDVNIYIVDINGDELMVKPNIDVAKNYKNALVEISEKIHIDYDLTISSLSRFNDIFTVIRKSENEEQIVKDVEGVLEIALQNFLSMREIEGKNVKNNILSILTNISEYINIININKDDIVKRYKEKLYKKIKDTLGDYTIDENRVLLEVSIFSEKVAIDEEIDRLKSHLEQFYYILNNEIHCGKKLDFLAQEINRETNTIGSKVSSTDIVKCIICIKNEVEKIREQVQNIE